LRDRTGEKEKDGTQNRSERPIEPGNMELRGGGFLQLAEHLRPEVAAEFGVARGRDCLLEELFHLFVVPFATHFALTSMPRQLSFLRSNRTARNTRTLTSATDMPAALAMLLYGSCSIREIGRASCRERVLSWVGVGAVVRGVSSG